MGLSPPTRSTSPSSKTRSSLTCIANGMSPISSRNNVPLSACSNFPMWRPAAPVNAPFSCPNSSDSNSSAGTAAQFSVTNGPSRRGDFSWMARATSSLPVPVWPKMHTLVSLAATRSICANSLAIAAPPPTSWCLPSRFFSSVFSSSRRDTRSAFSTVTSSLSVDSGFSRKSSAPSLVARTAMAMFACPEIRMTGAFMPAPLISSRNSSPLLPGITTSEKITSNFSLRSNSTARFALSQTVASCPARRNARESEARVFASSSTSRSWAFRVTIFRRKDSVARRGGFGCGWRGRLLGGCRQRFLGGHARLVAGQLNAKGGAVSFLAGHRDGSAVIAHHRLHNRQSQTGPLLLGRVIRRKQARALFRCQSLAGIGNLDAHARLGFRGAKGQDPARWHGIERIQNQVLERLVQQLRVAVNLRQPFLQEVLGRDRRLAHSVELRFEQLHGPANGFVEVEPRELRRRHLRKIAETVDDGIQIGEFRLQRCRRFVEDFEELIVTQLFRPL